VYAARIGLTSIDLYETRKLRQRALSGTIEPNEQKLYGINKIRQLPLILVEIVSVVMIWNHLSLLAIILLPQAYLFLTHNKQSRDKVSRGDYRFDGRVLILQVAEILYVVGASLFQIYR
jgi:hypothetical protein